jgi:heat shock protein HslJ
MKASKNILMTFAAAALLFVAACSPLAEASPLGTGQAPTLLPPAADELATTQWQLESFGAVGAEVPVLSGTSLTLGFDEHGQASGQGGCNSFGGQYKADSRTITFTELAQTLRACADESANQQEAMYMDALNSSGRFELNGDQLTIFYDGGASALHFVKA